MIYNATAQWLLGSARPTLDPTTEQPTLSTHPSTTQHKETRMACTHADYKVPSNQVEHNQMVVSLVTKGIQHSEVEIDMD